MKGFGGIIVAVLAWSHLCFAETPSKSALNQLIEGNQRFVQGKAVHKNLSEEAFADLKKGQTPIAVIVGCSDSRVPPEVIFDMGLGELFVVRVAGNVIGPVELDSIRFGIEKLKASLVMVLGHEDCAAVKDALYTKKNDPVLPNIFPLIEPALKNCHEKEGDPVMNAVWCNVLHGVSDLKQSLSKNTKVQIVGGYYDFDHGTVEIIRPTSTP